MKTAIPAHINTMDDVIKFLGELQDNGESYHPEDPAADIIGANNELLFTADEAVRLDQAMEQTYKVCNQHQQDPCELLLWMARPHRGREYNSTSAIEWSGHTFPKNSIFIFMKVQSDGRWMMRPVEAEADGMLIIVDKSNFQP